MRTRLAPCFARLLGAEVDELGALGAAFAYFFLLLCSYYLLRPVRDTLAVAAGAQTLRWLFSATFAAMLALVPLFGVLSARLPRATLLTALYAFFALDLVAFSVRLDAAVFFVWLSVFNLFAVSLFWSFMADLFDGRQAARLYGTLSAGGSCGAIAGPLIAAEVLDAKALLLLAAAMLAAIVICVRSLARWGRAHPRVGEPRADAPLGGSVLAGARAALTSPFLLAICGYLLCYTALSTALYFQQVAIVGAAIPEPAGRTRLFAHVDLAVNALTLLSQVLAFPRLVPRLGPMGMLAAVPLVSVAGFLWLGAAPTLVALIAFGIARRVGEFSISKPAREALFTIVPREARYKAKNFIDTVVYRGGDALSGWLFATLAGAAFVAAGISAGWAALAVYLGHKIGRWTDGKQGETADAASSASSPQERS